MVNTKTSTASKAQSAQRLDRLYYALSEPTRRTILERLAVRACTVAELAAPFSVSAPAISKHLAVLTECGLITRQRASRAQIISLRAEPLAQASQWLEKYRAFWEHNLDALDHFLQTAGEPLASVAAPNQAQVKTKNARAKLRAKKSARKKR